MTRGEFWTVGGGMYSSKPRPALIVQDDAFSETSSITVAPLTTTFVDAPLIRVRVEADEVSGLARDSDVMIDKVTTVRCHHLGERVGRASSEQMTVVERCLLVFLGLAR